MKLHSGSSARDEIYMISTLLISQDQSGVFVKENSAEVVIYICSVNDAKLATISFYHLLGLSANLYWQFSRIVSRKQIEPGLWSFPFLGKREEKLFATDCGKSL